MSLFEMFFSLVRLYKLNKPYPDIIQLTFS